MAHFLCHLGCSHFGALLLDFYFTENRVMSRQRLFHCLCGAIFELIFVARTTRDRGKIWSEALLTFESHIPDQTPLNEVKKGYKAAESSIFSSPLSADY